MRSVVALILMLLVTSSQCARAGEAHDLPAMLSCRTQEHEYAAAQGHTAADGDLVPDLADWKFRAGLIEPESLGSRLTLVGHSEILNGDPADDAGIPPLISGWQEPILGMGGKSEEGACIEYGDMLPRLSLGNDIRTAPVWLVQSLRALPTWENAAFLTLAAGGSLSLRGQVDHAVQQDLAEHGPYWNGASQALNHAGEAIVHIPLLAGMYSYSLYTQDEDLHGLTLALIKGYKFTAIATLGLQYASQTRHGDTGILSLFKDNGFPSMPASTGFAMAAVVDERYGWKVGVPAYLGAGLVSWAGIDQQQHRVSDVAFGVALGYVIGKSIGALHYRPDDRYKLVPFVDAGNHSQGLQLVRSF